MRAQHPKLNHKRPNQTPTQQKNNKSPALQISFVFWVSFFLAHLTILLPLIHFCSQPQLSHVSKSLFRQVTNQPKEIKDQQICSHHNEPENILIWIRSPEFFAKKNILALPKNRKIHNNQIEKHRGKNSCSRLTTTSDSWDNSIQTGFIAKGHIGHRKFQHTLLWSTGGGIDRYQNLKLLGGWHQLSSLQGAATLGAK